MIIMLLTIVGIYFTVKYISNKAREENMSKIDFAKDKGYYREILKEYSPAELSYIDNFKIEIPREIVAIVLNLKLKNKIEIAEDKIKVIDSNTDGLKRTEKFILENIVDGKVKIDNSGYIESYAQDEAIKDGLVRKNTDGDKRSKKMFIKCVAIGIFLFVLFIIICNNIEKLNQFNEIGMVIGLILIFICAGIFFVSFPSLVTAMITYHLMQINSYGRTEKGEEINKRIEGLKQYIADYSLLDERGKNDLNIWEEYLIYSVIFDLNDTTIVSEIAKLIEIEFQYGKIYIKGEKN